MSCLLCFIGGVLKVCNCRFNYSFGFDSSKYSVRNVMNLLIPAVWYVVVTCTVSVPRPMHYHGKHSANKHLNHFKSSKPSSLQLLEEAFLGPNTKPPRRQSLLERRQARSNNFLMSSSPPTVKLQLETIGPPTRTALHSFRGNSSIHRRHSNLIKRRNARRRKLKNPRNMKRSFLPHNFMNLFKVTQPPDDDFFGLFTNGTSAKPIVEESFENETGKVAPYNPLMSPGKWCKKTKAPLNGHGHALKPRLTDTQPKVKPSSGRSKNVKRHRDPPVDISSLYMDRYENSKRDLSDFFSGNEKEGEEEETPDEKDHAVIMGEEDSETTEGDASTESSVENLPEHLDENTPEHSGENPPGHSGENIPEHSGENIPEHSSEKIPQSKDHSGSPGVYDKSKCEEVEGKKCICIMKELYGDYRKVFLRANSRSVVLSEIGALTCKKYSPVKDQYALSAHIAPRVLSKNKKPLAINAEKGPKELEPSSLEDTIRDIASQKDDTKHVLVNTDITLSCFPTDDLHMSASAADQVTYKWTHGNKKAITDGRMVENADGEGTLMIQDVSVTDSDNYTCSIDYINPDNGYRTEESYVHSVLVVALPILTVRVTVHYRASIPCDSSVVEMFELYLPQQLEADICSISSSSHLCRVEIHSPVCQTNSGERAEREVESSILVNPLWTREKREDSLEMSLNFEVYIHRSEEKSLSSGNSTLCGPKCHLLLYLRMLQLLHTSMGDVALTPVSVDVKEHAGVFEPEKGSLKVKYIIGCIGGYHLDQGFCVPCPMHTFSDDGATECTECPPYTYQGSTGARKCIPCSSQWIPTCNEYFETVNISIIIAIVGLVIILLIAFLVWYNLRVKQKKFDTSSFKRKLKFTKSKKEKLGYLQKQKKKRDVGSKELVQLLDSSEGEIEATSTAEESDSPRYVHGH